MGREPAPEGVPTGAVAGANTGAVRRDSLMPMTSPLLAGRLVVATPGLADPNFSHAVVLILEHSAEGAVGLVLNRPSDSTVASVLAGWERVSAPPPVVFVGGPVQSGEAMVALGRVAGEAAAMLPVLPGVGLVDLATDPEAASAREVRLFTGYAGWGGGQLEREIEAGGWFLVDARADDAFTTDSAGLWRAVLTRQGGVYKTVVEDPSRN